MSKPAVCGKHVSIRKKPMMDSLRRFGGIRRLYGDAAYERMAQSHIAVVGVGGVGSWAAEALARTGVGHITLIDLDSVAESNTNRQLQALTPHFGAAKVDVLAERIRLINPQCQLTLHEDFLDETNMSQYLPMHHDSIPKIDGVIDAIDQVRMKAALVDYCAKAGIALVISGAAGGKKDPTRICVKDLSDITHDPLLANLRYRLRKHYAYPKLGRMQVMCVASSETVTRPPHQACATDPLQGLSCAGYGASMMMTASMGLAAVAALMEALG
jgi:tRNA A37 threonylcarbamoyladenosine dehydratase